MKELLESELIYGRLMEVAEPHLVARYNKALAAFGLPQTARDRFQIDMTGFSPEIAEDLKDKDYLDPNRVNRRFIILRPDQENLPVVHTSFSNTAALMHEFFQGNARAINAVTIKDVLYGEIEDSVSVVDDIEDLLSINEVEFRVLSAENMLQKAGELRLLADRLKTAPDAWRDDDLLTRMVELARETGDIRQNALVPDVVRFRHDAFWTNHFGGVFIFVDDKRATVICDPAAPGFRRSRPWQVSYIGFNDPARVFEFLASTGRIELPRASWVLGSGLLEHRAKMALNALVHYLEPEIDLDRVDAIWLQTWMHRNAGLLMEEGTYPFLQDMLRQIGTVGQVKIREVRPDRRFALIRAAPAHADQWLVNRLIARYLPYDFVSRFVFDKDGFYAAYERYNDTYKSHVVSVLKNTYLKDKAALRRQLYGIGENPRHA